MANNIRLSLDLNTADSYKSLGDLEDRLNDLKTQIKDVEVGSDVFKEMSNEIRTTESRVKNLTKSFEGMDIDQLTGEFGRLTGGIAAGFAGVQAILPETNESMEKMVQSVLKWTAVAQGFRGAAEAVTASMRIFNNVIKGSPLLLWGTILAGVTAGVIALVGHIKKKNEELEKIKDFTVDLEEQQEAWEEIDLTVVATVEELEKYFKYLEKQKNKQEEINIALQDQKNYNDDQVDFQQTMNNLKQVYLTEEERLKDLLAEREEKLELMKLREDERLAILKQEKLVEETKEDLYNEQGKSENEIEKITAKIHGLNKKINQEKEKTLKTEKAITKELEKQELESIFRKGVIEQDQEAVEIYYRALIDENQQYIDKLGLDMNTFYSERLTDEQVYQENLLLSQLNYTQNRLTNEQLTAEERKELELENWKNKLEIERFYNGVLINYDKELYDEKLKRAKAGAANLEKLEEEHLDNIHEIEMAAAYNGFIEYYDTQAQYNDEKVQQEIEYLEKQKEELARYKEEVLQFRTDEKQEELDIIKSKEEEIEKQLKAAHRTREGLTRQHAQEMLSIYASFTGSIGELFGNIGEWLVEDAGRKKAFAKFEATLNGARAVMEVWSSAIPWWLKLARVAVVTSATLAQINKINKAEYTYEEGGMLSGPRHKDGGIRVGNIELEGGEAVLNKRSMANPSLRNLASAINVAGGGSDFSVGSAEINLSERSIREIVNGINDKKVYVLENEITDLQQKVRIIENHARI